MNHVQQRMIQRYNLDLKSWELGKISNLIQQGKYIIKIDNAEQKEEDDKRIFFYIIYKNLPLKVLYSIIYGRLITVYPLDVDEYNKIKEGRKMITKYSTEGCSACKKMGILLEQIGVPFKEVDVTDNFDLISELNIKKVPTLINDKGERLEGLATTGELRVFCGLED